jgi:hypothetical protein
VFKIVSIKISNPGSGYVQAPNVLITGDGTGVIAKAYISNGKISKILLTNPGSGYTSAPTVSVVGGVGSNLQNAAKAIAVIGGSKVRTFDMKIKFDRISKTPKFKSFSFDEKFKETENLK